MSNYLAEAHTEWHAVNGRFVVCPLDCGVTEGLYDEADQEEAWLAAGNGIRCGHCRDRHATVSAVRACAGVAR